MTDDAWLETSERATLTALLAAIFGLIVADAASDWAAGGTARHLAIETVVAGAAAVAIAILWIRHLRVRARLRDARRSLDRVAEEARRWREENARLVRGLSDAIEAQLAAWHLTPAEKEVAFLLLKGLSLKEAAAVRGASERTVRQQALAIYAKSGVAGRAELAAFFLEDLLVPASRLAPRAPAPGAR
ncbi:MAG TPA: helix-turn-helix transcriptional regulator [Candidatus Binatia bacterium]|nr:helix-turn-helix transcriptional regulator [Candidatus Binatia bacterium]